jgi:hypothetical protein
MVSGEPCAAALAVAGAGPQGGDSLAGDQPVFAGELVYDRKRSGNPLPGVDHDRDGGDMAAQLQEAVAVRRVVAVKAPDAALGGGAAEPGRAQPADDGPVDRLPVVQGRLGGVDHELVPKRHAVVIGAGQLGRGGEQKAVPLADANAFQGEQRALQQRAEFNQDAADPLPGADGDDHHRDLGVPAEERGPFAAAVRGAVDAEQCGGAVEAAALQQVADRDEGRHPADAVLAAQVDG